MPAIISVNALNGGMIALVKLAEMKDIVAIALGLVSLICTVIMTWHNLRKDRKR